MKMPQSFFETLKTDIQAYGDKHLGFGTRGLRDYWDAMHAIMMQRDAQERRTGWSYVYDTLQLNDANIETALRRIMQA